MELNSVLQINSVTVFQSYGFNDTVADHLHPLPLCSPPPPPGLQLQGCSL